MICLYRPSVAATVVTLMMLGCGGDSDEMTADPSPCRFREITRAMRADDVIAVLGAPISTGSSLWTWECPKVIESDPDAPALAWPHRSHTDVFVFFDDGERVTGVAISRGVGEDFLPVNEHIL
jgi:hypothetical protein